MSNLHRIPVTKALKANYELLRRLVACGGLEWIVVRTNPNCEERALASLAAAGLVAWLPMLPKCFKRKRGRGEHDRSKPMCTRYLFVGLDRVNGKSTADVIGCDGVEKVLSFHLDNSPHIVPKAQIQVIVEEEWRAITHSEYKPIQVFDIGAPVKLVNAAYEPMNFRVEEVDEAQSKVSGKVTMFNRELAVAIGLDKLKRSA